MFADSRILVVYNFSFLLFSPRWLSFDNLLQSQTFVTPPNRLCDVRCFVCPAVINFT